MGNHALKRGENQVSRLYDDPFRSIEERMNQLMQGMITGTGVDANVGNYPVDVVEDEEGIVIEAEMPGFKRDEIDVNVENGVLTIKAERNSAESNGKQRKRHLSERRYTRVQRSFTLPRSVDGSEVEASLSNGLLTLTLKKTEESKPRRIEIKDHS